MALINQLNNLGDAVRERTGTTQLYTLDEMAETIRNIPSEGGGTSFYTGPGIYLSEDGELGVKTGPGIGINENGELMTEAWWIPYADTNVGDKLDELQNRVEGVNLIDLWSNTNAYWTTENEAYLLNAELEVLHTDLYENLMADEVSEFDIEAIIEGETFGRGFRTRVFRQVVEQDGSSFVVYANGFEEGDFSFIVINATTNATSIGVVSEELINQNVNRIIIRFVEQSISVQHINTMDGIWKNEYDNGRVVDIGIDRGYIEAIVDERGGQGGGGDVAIDGKTIIMNENGQIATALGGGKVISVPETPAVDYASETGFTKVKSGNARYGSMLSNYLTSLDKNTKYTVELEYRNANTNETGRSVGYMTYSGASYASWTCYELSVFDDTIQSMDYASGQGIFLTGAMSGDAYYQVYYITKFRIITPAIYDYETIDAKYLPLGNGIQVNAEGQLTTPLEDLQIDGKSNMYISTNLNDYNTGSNCVALGYSNTLMGSGNGKVALGRDNNVYGSASVALGDANKYGLQSGYGHVMVGYNNSTKQTHALAVGGNLIAASAEQCVYGKYNIEDSASTYNTIIGNGTSSSRANGLTIAPDGSVVTQGTISNAGADYAEYFEWADGNPNSEDRVGLLVTLDGNKIRYAKAIDDVLGVVSGTATVLGDDAEWVWQGKYLRDDFGRIIMEDVEIALDEEKTEFTTIKAPKINPEYDESKPYVSRANRPEWDAIGMMGKLFVKDDGTCVVNGYAMPGENGLATSATGKTNMRVMERISDNIVRVLLK